MSRPIRIYIEGGGDSADGRAFLRQGFRQFLDGLVQLARQRRTRFDIILCGARNSACDDFKAAMQIHRDALNILLVDAEAPVSGSCIEHLKHRDSWDLDDVDESQIHLMVQTMEAWLIADITALSEYYGQGFRVNSFPAAPVETVDKERLLTTLITATRDTRKGEYRKIRDASRLLALVDSRKVRQAAPHCERFFAVIEDELT